MAVFLSVVIGLAWASYQLGRKSTDARQNELGRELQSLKDSNAKFVSESVDLRKQAIESVNQARIDRASYDSLAQQIKSLSAQNAALKEDLTFFQTLLSSSDGKPGITVNQAKLERDSVAGEYRYRLHLLQTGPRIREFDGRLQLTITYESEGASVVKVLPDKDEKNIRPYQLKFKFYKLVEGGFKLDPKAVVKNVQLKILESSTGQVQANETVNLS